MTIGERIKQLREERGWSPEELAKRIKRSVTIVYEWERGAKEPRRANRKKLCEIFNITDDELRGIISAIPIKDIEVPIVSSVGATDDLGRQAFEPFEPPYKTISFKNCKAVIVESNSMAPIAYKGQKIIYCESENVHNGELVFIKLKSGDQLFKRYFTNHKNHVITLQSVNPTQTYDPLTIEEKDIEFCYKVVGVKF